MRLDGYQQDTIIVPEGVTDMLADMTSDVRTFPAKWVDETPGASVLGMALREAPMEANGRWNSGEVDAMILINPTYTSTREELKENGLQTLRRFLALSYAYPFPTTDVLREPEFNRDRLTVMVHRLDEYGGFWEEVCPPV